MTVYSLERIPKVDVSNRAPYEYKPFPRMMTEEDEEGVKKPILAKNGEPVIVHSEEEEAAFWAKRSKKAAPEEVKSTKTKAK